MTSSTCPVIAERSGAPADGKAAVPLRRQAVGRLRLMGFLLALAVVAAVQPIRVDLYASEPVAGVPDKTKSALPGSKLTLDAAMKEFTFVAVCEAIEKPAAKSEKTGIYAAEQEFKVVESLAGDAKAGAKVRVSYAWFETLKPREKGIAKSERVIWIARKKGDRLVGVKALADTPANRKAVKKAAAGEGEPALPGSEVTLEEMMKKVNVYGYACGALDGARSRKLEGKDGVYGAGQRFEISEILIDRKDLAGQAVPFDANFGYTWKDLPDCRERPIRKGEKVILLMGYGPPAAGKMIPEAVKALADTPANRRAVKKAVAARAATRADGKTPG